MAVIRGATTVSEREAALKSLLDDVTDIHTQFTALLTKLDADAGITDVDYVSTTDVAALTTTQ